MPGPSLRGSLRWMMRMRGEALEAMDEVIAAHGDRIQIGVGPLRAIILNRPEDVAHVLQGPAHRYHKSPSYANLELVLGKGLVTSEGAFWRRQRRIAQPAFHPSQLRRFGPVIVKETRRTLAAWRESAGEAQDISRAMTQLTLRIIGQALFSADLSSESDALGQAVHVAMPFVNDRMDPLRRWPLWLPLPSHRRFKRALASLDSIVDGLIAQRRQLGQSGAPRDLLSALVFAQDPESGESMTARQLRDEVMTFLLAGHETTATAMAWTLRLLSQEPEIERALAAEVDAVLADRPPRAEELAKLDLTRRVIQESMRLRPPVWIIERQALEDDAVSGFTIPKGSIVLMCAHTLHRHPDYWDEPDRFDPDRFLPEAVAARARCAYLPFGAGQRQCIGEGLAMLEMILILAMITRSFRLEADPDQRIEVDPFITLRPRQGLLMTPRPR